MKSLFIAILLINSALAENATPSAQNIEPYQLKRRSTFTLGAETRVPFWPIGWDKSKPTSARKVIVAKPSAAPKPKFEILPQHFSVSSVLLGRPALATINGRSFAEGEVLPVIADETRLHVILKAVRDGGVWLEHEGRQVYVPMRRQEVDTNRQIEQQPQSSEFAIRIGAPPEASKAVSKEAINDALNEALKQ
jgi:hypothetical protein